MGQSDLTKDSQKPQSNATRKLLLTGVGTVIVGFVTGILIGRFAICPGPEQIYDNDGLLIGTFLPGIPESIIQDGDPGVGQQLIDAVDNKRIEGYLRKLTEKPHVAGSQANLDLALWMKESWEEFGFDDVTLAPYEILLSFPDPDNPNVVRVLDENGDVVYESPLKEANLTGEEDPDALPPYNAYSPPGLVEGEMVYVNYGRVEDYNWLENNTNINVTGKIAIARYGKIFRGSKVDIAADHGAIGVILYSDPADFTDDSDPRVYPDTWWLPGSGAQRGSILGTSGDPLTPGYPATKNAYRYNETSPEVRLPKIPAHPIGYDIAEQILSEMGGDDAPTDWQGKLNITYKLGPALAKSGWKVQMNISTRNEMKTVFNLIGLVKGLIEPEFPDGNSGMDDHYEPFLSWNDDRYVMMGNHRDAWVYGAIDPSSGTAVMMEAARVIGEKVKSGKWRPRRSIMFCSWGAEEYGLIGSNEWAEQYVKTLRARAVAYINVDLTMQGNHSLSASSTPLMYRATYEAAKKVPNPNAAEVAAGRKTVYDTWLETFPWKDDDNNDLNIPKFFWVFHYIFDLGFCLYVTLQIAGVTSVDFRFTFNPKKYSISSYPLYHSVYETFYLVKNIMDKQFHFHQAVSRMATELARSLADSLIIPFNVSDYSWAMENFRNTIDKEHGTKLRLNVPHYGPNNDGKIMYFVTADDLKNVIANFSREVEIFNERVSKMNKNDPMAIRAVNDQLSLLEKAFLDDAGLPDRPVKKHLLLAESSKDTYAGSSFPGLVDLMFEIDKAPDVDERWELVKRHFSVLVHTIESAASTLRDVIKFIPDI